MKKLKLFFACLLMAVLSIGQVWADDYSYTFTSKVFSANDDAKAYTLGDVSWNHTSSQVVASGKSAYWGYDATKGQQWGSGNAQASVTLSTDGISGTISQVVINASIGNSGSATLSVSVGGVDFECNDATSVNTTTAATAYTFEGSGSGTITITYNSAVKKAIYMKSIAVTYSTGGGSEPIVNVSPASWDFGTVHASAEASKVFSVSGSNLTAGNLTLTVPDGFSVDPSSIAVDGTLAATDVTVSKNTSTEDDYAGNLSIIGGGLASAKTVGLTMTVDADPAPTGTFELFSGALEEGDYVIVNTNALSNTVNSSRIAAEAVTISEGQIVNPAASVVWHIAQSGDYWTIYNAEAAKYAGGTTTKNQGDLLDDVADLSKWSCESTSSSTTYDFANKGRAEGSSDTENKWLRYNAGTGNINSRWGCYGTGIGSALTLYKKQVAGQPATPTFSIPGGNYESAQTVEISCATDGATIYYTLDGTTPTNTSSVYSTALNISSTTTVTAIAIKNDISSIVASATYTIIVWQTVADVWDDITVDGPLNAHIYGYVSQTNVSGYANNFYISDNGSTEGNQLYAYRMDMNSYSVEVGDKVKLAGDLTIHNETTKQFKYTNAEKCGKVIAKEAKGALQSIVVDGTPTKTEYAANEDFDPSGLKVYGTYANGFVGEITEGITWGNDLTDGKVTESTTVHVTATVSEIASPAYDVAVTVAAKTLVSIAVGTASYTIYTGEALPQPVVTATFSEGEPEDVSAFAVYDSENVFNTATIDNPDPQTITVSYTFGGATQTATYTVSVKDYANADDAPYTVTEALHIITDAIGNAESAREIVVAGTVSQEKISNYKNRYKISDGTNELLVYNGKGFDSEAFTDANYPKENDVVIVKGNVIYFNNATPEFASTKSYLLSQVRPATLAIENITGFEVGSADLEEDDLTITTASDGDITFVSGDETVVTIKNGNLHAVAAGTATITANLAATENVGALNYSAATTTFDVTVIAAQVKYTITFDGNGADGGSAPTAIADQAAGASVPLPANTYKKTGKVFDGWKVINNTTTEEVTVTAGAFLMPASAVTIQAQWTDAPYWATVYDHITGATVAHTGSGVDNGTITISEASYNLVKAGSKNNTGTIVVTVPVGTTDLHFHAFAWGGKTAKIELTGVTNPSVSEFNLEGESGAAGEGNDFTLQGDPVDQYFHVSFDAVEAETEITFSKASGSEDNRFFFYGVNQVGGVLPVLDHITITGTMTNTTGWKTGDNIVPEGLTVYAIYTLNNVEQTPVEVDPNDVVWSHAALVENQTEVTLTATYTENTIVKSANVNVTIEAVETGDPTITTDVNSRSWIVNKGAAIPAAKTFAVTLKNIASATVTPGGDNPDAFNITPATLTASGNITVSVVSTATVGTYTATITIKDDASATSKVVNVSLTVENEEVPVSTTSEWVAATEITDGMEVLITGVKDAVTYAMGADRGNNRFAVAGTLDGDVFTPGENTMSFTLVAQDGGTFALRASNGKYLYAGGTGNNNYLNTKAYSGELDANAKWNITLSSIIATSSNHNEMRFNYNNNNPALISCYQNSSTNPAVALYVPKPVTPPTPAEYEEVRNGLNEGEYYTMCLDRAVTAVKAGSIWRVLSKAANGNDVILEEAELPLVAGRPYIFRAAASTLEVAYTGDAVGAPVNDDDNNGLIGSFSQVKIANVNTNYIIYNNALYYVNSDNVYVGEHRAYLDMNGVPPYVEPQQGNNARRRVTMAVYGKDEAQGFDNLESGDAPKKVMINGTLYIFRGEKQYDATGRLVK